jgi:hypothetical protein
MVCTCVRASLDYFAFFGTGKAHEKAETAKPKQIAHPIDTKSADQLSKKQVGLLTSVLLCATQAYD